MVAVTYDVVGLPAAGRAAAARTPPRSRWYGRLVDALIEARLEQARREVARHRYLLPYSLDERGDRLVRAGARDMPFGGW